MTSRLEIQGNPADLLYPTLNRQLTPHGYSDPPRYYEDDGSRELGSATAGILLKLDAVRGWNVTFSDFSPYNETLFCISHDY
jgi:hypothetical protein